MLLEELSNDLEYDSELSEIILELSNDLDISVNINHPDEFEKAVKTGMHLLLCKYLQKLYLSLRINITYESGNYLSPKNLQWISIDSGQEKKHTITNYLRL